ncbi:MAG: response regulator transcription factor [Sulfurimonas sp.]|nr:response regulator transcription factor [Sulfurimonas sp.]
MNNYGLIDDVSILIVEDEEELRDYLQEYLQLFFKYIFVAKCGEDGYNKYLQKKPDIIISDVNMPNLDGLTMIKRIRQNDDNTNIIVMSAHSEQDKLLQAIELNLVTYLIKPINVQKLKDILLNIVNDLKDSKKRVYLNQDIYWDKTTSKLWNILEEIPLKEKESMIFELLLSKINHPFTSKDIFFHLYGEQAEKEFSEYSITSFIKRLRSKLPQNIIQNEYGSGYKITLKNHS